MPCSLTDSLKALSLRLCCLCRYEPFIVAQLTQGLGSSTELGPAQQGDASSRAVSKAQHSMPSSSDTDNARSPALPDQKSVETLRGYIAEISSEHGKLAAGLPILSDSSGKVQVVVESESQVSSLPLCVICASGLLAVSSQQDTAV